MSTVSIPHMHSFIGDLNARFAKKNADDNLIYVVREKEPLK